VMSTSSEAPHYAIFFSLLLFHPIFQIFSTPCSQMALVYVPPFMSEVKFNTRTKPHIKLF
jgi:hypothetical protein